MALDGDTPKQSHTTIASIERASDGSYVLKNIKQKLFVDGLSYLLQEIYGLENKAADLPNKPFDEDIDDCGADCVVCMCDLRDTIILPCRHLCLCYACAESLRYQASNCPICRAPFIALLQIRAVQKMSHATHPALAGTEFLRHFYVTSSRNFPQCGNYRVFLSLRFYVKSTLHVIGTDPPTQEGVPPGYVSVSLVDALNGPNKDNPGANMGMIVNSDDVTLTTNVSKSAAKKSRKQRRGSKEGSGKASSAASTSGPAAPGTSCCVPPSATGGPRQSSSTSSQLSQASISEEPEPATPVNLSENSSSKDSSSSMVNNPKAAKLAPETSVKVSLQIVNEVEQAQSATGRKPLNDESLDIVEEELAKMAVAESLTDLPLEISIGDADSTRITEIDIDDDDDDDVDDDGDDGDDEDEIDDIDQEDEAVVITLPISTDTLGAKPQGGSLPGNSKV